MQLKAADDKQRDIDALGALLTRPDAAGARPRIEDEIRTIHAGAKAEREAAYEIEFYCRDARNFVTIHGLRLDVDGVVAQFDHLILDRLLQIWVCESKSFAEGVAINEFGEWSAVLKGRRTPIPSPIEQNRRQIHVLDRAFESGLVRTPRRIIRLKPSFMSIVLLSTRTSIDRPQRETEELVSVVKADQLWTRIQRRFDEVPAWNLLRVVSADTIEGIGQRLVALHAPFAFNWPAKFGLATQAPPTPAHAATGRTPAGPSGLNCASCKVPVSFAEVDYCRLHSERFSGAIYCMPCQAKVASRM